MFQILAESKAYPCGKLSKSDCPTTLVPDGSKHKGRLALLAMCDGRLWAYADFARGGRPHSESIRPTRMCCGSTSRLQTASRLLGTRLLLLFRDLVSGRHHTGI
eukprot:2090087-Pyramimonas_sp.AAC.1